MNKVTPQVINSNDYVLDTHIYKVSDIDTILSELNKNNIVRYKKETYINYPFSFDIETTSFYEKEEKRGIMYAFVVGINNKCIIGRTWEEFIKICNKISDYFLLSDTQHVLMYVHNLQFEFQFLRKRFEWFSIFATDTHEPLKAITKNGIEFRCSYRLSGYKLEKVAENLQKYKVRKMVGDLDYSLLRNSKTPLTEKELGYILNDGLVVLAYIKEEIEQHNNNIGKIELTKTGKVRTLCKSNCLFGGYRNHKNENAQKNYQAYRNFMNSLTLDAEEYKQLKRVFQGGFTHANSNYVRKIVKDVHSYDFSSAYPSVLLLNKYPLSAPKKVKINSDEDLLKYLNYYCCMFDIIFTNIKSKVNFEHYISISKCWKIKNVVSDNGRLVKGDVVGTSLTEQDFFIIKEMYTWDSIEIYNFRVFKRGYLPKNFLNTILVLYAKKNQLKNVEGKEVEYLNAKENLNSLYGMCVTDINHADIEYKDNERIVNESDLEKNLDKYNNDKFRYLYFAWGVWCTAYNRCNLFKAILHLKDDYIYSDTDSVKFKNYEEHVNRFNNYNESIKKRIKFVSEKLDLNINMFSPKTIEGKVKTIGLFDYEGKYLKFKTLGAKRYLVKKENNELVLTTSGLAKNTTIKFLMEKFNNNERKIFSSFDNGLYVPKGYTGKLIHTYIENETEGTLIDYLGNEDNYKELSSVHLEDSDYTLDFAKEFIKYLMNIKDYLV